MLLPRVLCPLNRRGSPPTWLPPLPVFPALASSPCLELPRGRPPCDPNPSLSLSCLALDKATWKLCSELWKAVRSAGQVTPELQPGASHLSPWKDTQMASAWAGTGVGDGTLPWTWDEWALRDACCSWGWRRGAEASSFGLSPGLQLGKKVAQD